MAHIAKRKDRPGYIARWTAPDGKEKSKSFGRRVDAEKFLTMTEAAKLQGSYSDPKLGKTVFGPYADSVVSSWTHLRPGTACNVQSRMRRHILPAFGNRPIAAIQPSEIRTWLTGLVQSGLAASTVRATYRNLAKILRTAEIDRLIPRSPCIGIDLPKETAREEMLVLAPDEIRALAEAIEPRYSALIYTAAYAGPRWGELAALKVGRVNLEAATVDIVESLADVNGHLHLGPTKTGKRRTLELPGFLVKMLRAQMGIYPSTEGHVFSAAKGGAL